MMGKKDCNFCGAMISLGFRIPLVYISAFSWDGVAAHGMANRQQFFGRPDSGVLLC